MKLTLHDVEKYLWSCSKKELLKILLYVVAELLVREVREDKEEKAAASNEEVATVTEHLIRKNTEALKMLQQKG